MEIVDYLQGRGKHSIEVLLALHAMSIADGLVDWKDVKQWFRQHGSTISDGTFRRRRVELVELGLAEKVNTRDPLKFAVKLTAKGEKVAELLEDLIEKLQSIEKQE